jgi:hypothetical protein
MFEATLGLGSNDQQGSQEKSAFGNDGNYFTKTDFGAQSLGNLLDGTLSNGNDWQVAKVPSNPGRVSYSFGVAAVLSAQLTVVCLLTAPRPVCKPS